MYIRIILYFQNLFFLYNLHIIHSLNSRITSKCVQIHKIIWVSLFRFIYSKVWAILLGNIQQNESLSAYLKQKFFFFKYILSWHKTKNINYSTLANISFSSLCSYRFHIYSKNCFPFFVNYIKYSTNMNKYIRTNKNIYHIDLLILNILNL